MSLQIDRSGSYQGKCSVGKQDVWRIRRQADNCWVFVGGSC